MSLLKGIAGQHGSLDGGAVATASSRLMLLLGSLSLKKSETSLTMRGIQVDPPTKTISWMLDLSILESRRTFSTGSRELRKRSGRVPQNARKSRRCRNRCPQTGSQFRFNGGLYYGRESALGTPTSSAETMNSMRVRRQVWKKADELVGKYN